MCKPHTEFKLSDYYQIEIIFYICNRWHSEVNFILPTQHYYWIWNDKNMFNCWSHDVFVRRSHFSDWVSSGNGILYLLYQSVSSVFTQCKTGGEWNKSIPSYIKYKNENNISLLSRHVHIYSMGWMEWIDN